MINAPDELSITETLAKDIIQKLMDINYPDIPNTNYQHLLGDVDITFPLLTELTLDIATELDFRNDISFIQTAIIKHKLSAILPSLAVESLINIKPPNPIYTTGIKHNKVTEVIVSKNYRISKESASEIPHKELKNLCPVICKRLAAYLEHIEELLSAFEAKGINKWSEMTESQTRIYKFLFEPFLAVITAKSPRQYMTEAACSSWFDQNYMEWAITLVSAVSEEENSLVTQPRERLEYSCILDHETTHLTHYPFRVELLVATYSTTGICTPLAVADMKSYVALDVKFEDILFTDTFHTYFHELIAQMLLNKVNCGFLTNSLELAYFEFDFTTPLALGTVPVRYKILNNRSSGLTMRMLLAAILYKRLNRTEEQKRDELQALETFSKKILNSPGEIAAATQLCVQDYFAAKRLDITEYNLIELKNGSRTYYSHSHRERHNEIITIPKSDFLNSFPNYAIFHGAIKSSDETVVLKIYDFSRTIVIGKTEDLMYHDVLSDSRSHFNTESTVYRRICRLNDEANTAIATARVFGFFQNLQILVKDKYYFAGDVIAMEELTAKPKTAEHFDKGLQQLRLLHQNGIVHNDVKIDNMFMNNENEFVYIDFELSECADLLISKQLPERETKQMASDLKKWSKTRNEILGDVADMQ